MNAQEFDRTGDGKTGCLVCGETRTRITRGLCVLHHNRWLKQRDSMPDERRSNYDDALIRRGLLLPSRQGRQSPTDDVFADVAAELLDDSLVRSDSPAMEKAAERVAKVEQLQEDNKRTETPAPKKRRTPTKKKKQ